ncbi:unnamed protein product, partial [Mesorhabditis spiculigera]
MSSPDPPRSSVSSGSASTDPHTDILVPSSDKEGWCRNKKYIEKVPAGYMCTVCKKVYGRYNSVSYHVTIYHRNPPIRCEQPGCNFTTREARYIHFHKYYRHHIPLPDTIDLGSRKCPFCRHVSKSPAMLEKHIARHVPGDRTTTTTPLSVPLAVYPSLNVTLSTGAFSFPPIHHQPQQIHCTQCHFTTDTVLSLSHHLTAAHASLTFTKCTLCDFESTNASLLLQHIQETHQ